eukprot:COSAG01_NODE_3378_length_6172_cov_8.333114_4_plen_104_part_00
MAAMAASSRQLAGSSQTLFQLGDLVEPKIFEEDAWQVSAAQIKAHRPNTTVVVWMDSLRIYTADKALNPGLKRPCAQGHFRPAEFLESGAQATSRCKAYHYNQ